jgi:hypothetical protein
VRAVHSSAAIPPPAELHRALGGITERLALELASPSPTAPDWSDYEWTIARAVAAMHGISPLLSRSLLWRGPQAWATFLDEQRSHTQSRHWRIQELLQSIHQQARETGVAATALKGAALHQLGLYEAGDRPMADVDLLVRPADAERTATLLASLGFRQTAETWKERVFTPVDGSAAADLGEHASNSLKIELHERICERLPRHLTDVSESIFATQPLPGLNSYPSNGSLMLHLLLHAAGTMAFQALRIVQLHDIALLSGRMSDADWNEIAEPNAPAPRWWAYPPLELTARYYRGSVPARVLGALKSACPYILRALGTHKSLVEVSYSYLWIKAFPGIEWSQSLLEMVDYALSRVRPDAKHLALRENQAASQIWAKQGDWSDMSQARRIARWLSSRQTRPATMHVIAAAFGQRR